MVRSRIIGTGGYAPETVLTNDDLARRIDTSDAWIRTRTGIRERRIAAEGEYTSDMALHAARRAIEAADKRLEDVDLIVVGTVTPDMPMPSAAAFLQGKLGARAPAFDISAACAGSVYALSVADKFVRCGDARCVLVVGAELLSRMLDWDDRTTCVLFGDAAGAMVIVPDERPNHGILSTHLHADGSLTDILAIPGGGSRYPVNHDTVEKRLQFVKMNGREVFRVAVRSLAAVVHEALEKNGLTTGDITWVVPHQANIRIVDAVLEKLDIPRARAILNIERYGNTSSASVPITLDEGIRDGRIKEGDIVLMMAIGAGMTWGAAVVRW